MENPFRSEAAAFRFLLLTIGGFALIVVGSLIDRWVGLAVAVALSVGAIALYLRQRGEGPARRRVVTSSHARRILVIANETLEGEALLSAIRERTATGPVEVYVVSPALNSKLRHWTSDEDGARDAAQARLDRSLARLGEAGLQAHGNVGDADPVQAVEDALRVFGADEIVLSTHPEGRSHWLERGVVDSVRDRFDVQLTHVVVDLERP